MIICEICKKQFKSLTQLHLNTHKLKLQKYKELYPNSPTYEIRTIKLMCSNCNIIYQGNINTPKSLAICNQCKIKGIKLKNNNKETVKKRERTIFEKTGYYNSSQDPNIKKKKLKKELLKSDGKYTNPLQNPNNKLKSKQTCIKKYNTSNPMKVQKFKEKQANTLLKIYDVISPLKNKDILNKMLNTQKDKYGGIGYSNKETKSKIDNTNLKLYGKTNYAKTDEYKEKYKETCIKRYGVDNPLKVNRFLKKREETFSNNFENGHPSRDSEVRKKTKETNIKKYGHDCSLYGVDQKEKTKNTLYKNYNVIHPMKSEIIKRKVIDTNLKKYGKEHYNQTEEGKIRIREKPRKIFLEKLNMILKEKSLINIDTNYEHAHYIHNWKCLKCDHEFQQIWNSIQQGFLCPKCNPKQYISKPESQILNFIKSILPNKKIINNTRQIITPKELDIYIPELKVAIEFNGLYWHSEEWIKDSMYHLNKTDLCEEKGIQLIHIFEDEWDYKKNIVKSRLQNILNIKSNVIYARNCIIKEIDPTTKNDFLEENHIQGKDSSSIKLGAFYKNDLISVMTFSKGNISKGSKSKEGIWELNRFCSKLDYQVVGIAGKLLNHFKNNYNWIEIFSYADKRWSKGNLYEKLGFELNYITSPNYWYVVGSKRVHRFNLRKRQDEPKDIPEWILRMNEGYSRVWDCGNYKFSIKNII